MKKLLALVLGLVLICSCFAGAQASVIEDLGYTPKADSITIQVINRVVPDENETRTYLEQALGSKIEFMVIQGDELTEKINLWAASGEKLPDMMTLSGRNQYEAMLTQEMLLPIEDLLDQYGGNIKASQSEYWTERMREKDGHIYALDNYTTYGDNQGVIIRNDWLENLGLAMPTTTDELYDVLYAFVHDDPDGNGEDDTYGWWFFGSGYVGTFKNLLAAFNCNPSQWIWKDGEIVYGPTCVEETAKAFEYLRRLYEDGLVNQDYLTATADDRTAVVHAGKVGVLGGVSIAYMGPSDSNYHQNNEDWAFLGAITGDEGYSGMWCNQNPAETVHAYGCCITVDSVDPELCMMYTNMICTTEMERYIICGEEGRHWNYDENGMVSYVDPYTDINARIAEGHIYSYDTPIMCEPYPSFLNPPFVLEAYELKWTLHEGWTPAMLITPPEINDNLIGAGMSTYVDQVYADCIMNGGDIGAKLQEMVDTLYRDYDLARQEDIRRAYGHENGYYAE